MPTDENQEALTPNHFLLGSSSGKKPKIFYKNTGQAHRNNWKTVQTVIYFGKDGLRNISLRWYEEQNGLSQQNR